MEAVAAAAAAATDLDGLYNWGVGTATTSARRACLVQSCLPRVPEVR